MFEQREAQLEWLSYRGQVVIITFVKVGPACA